MSIQWNNYPRLSTQELKRRISYDTYLLKQPAIHTITLKKVSEDRIACEEELNKRIH